MVPRSMLKEWALHTFPNATDYWTFRKMFTIQLALIGLAEFMLHLNRLNPEMLQIAQVAGDTFGHCQGRVRWGTTGANSTDLHCGRCISRSHSPISPYLAVWITICPPWHSSSSYRSARRCQSRRCFDGTLYSAPLLLGCRQRRFNLKRAWEQAHQPLNACVHPAPSAQGPPTAFSKSLLKMIVSVSQTPDSPLVRS